MDTNSRPKLTAALSNYITHVVYKSSVTDFQEIFRIFFNDSRRLLRDKPYNITMKVKSVMSEDLLLLRFVALMTDTRRVKRCIIIYRAWMLTPDIIAILLTR